MAAVRSRVARAAALLPVPFLVSVLVSVLALGGPSRAEAATTERVVSDRVSGLAISGLDPVSYFTHAAPLYGNADYEYSYAGVIWRFRNTGDQAAFAAHPEVYMPRYGGYDPVALARGVAVAGNPLVWAMVGERVYLFYDEKSRARFLDAPDDAIGTADDRWPAVKRTLVQ
jgi:hypothetical protein